MPLLETASAIPMFKKVADARDQQYGTVTAPDGTVLDVEYGGRINTRRGNEREEDARRAAEEQAIRDWERAQGRESFWNEFDQDYISGLEQYLPDYQQLLDRTGSSYEDIMGRSSEAAGAYGRGAEQFQDIYDRGGYTEAERGQIDQAQFRSRQDERAQREAQMQQMRMRGMGGSGLEAMSAMGAQQAGANAGLAASTDIATQAQNRALGALQAGTQFGGQAGQAADNFNQAHLGWQDQQQGLRGQWEQQALQNRGQLANMQEDQRRYQMSAAQSMIGDGDAPSTYNPNVGAGFEAGASAVDSIASNSGGSGGGSTG